ncbi:hypothetical protein [Senegalia sp. (in: firmicutes)]|uniref:hypothetical protein n=1 Tax=Senegalia sp. (in: firmicutes) TaxID=1924098 RepID=UPI003F96CEC8
MQSDKEEMVGVLTAMSIVSKRLAKQLQKLEEESKHDEEQASRCSKKSKEPCRQY